MAVEAAEAAEAVGVVAHEPAAVRAVGVAVIVVEVDRVAAA